MGNVPKLRFEGFDGEWLEKQLGEVITNKAKKYNPSQNSEVYKCIELEHLESDTGRLLGHTTSLDAGSIKNRFYPNNVLFGKLRPYLNKYHQPNFDGVCSSEIWVLSGLKVSDDFAYRIVQTPNFLALANQSSGSKMPRADWKVVESGTVSIPPSEREQQKIAAFLTAVDTKLEQLTQKEALLKQYKKGVMQKIFSQEIRFKADDGSEFPEWNSLPMSELGKTFNGLTGKTGDDFGDGQPYIQYKQIFDNSKIDLVNTGLVRIVAGERQQKAKYGDVFFTTSSETPNEVAYASVLLDQVDNLYLNSFCFGYRANSLKQLLPEFSRYYFRSEGFRREAVKLAQGSTRYNISKTELMKTIIDLPCIDEQRKIALCLTALDDKLELVSGQIDNAKTFKKGLLQQMFV